MLELFVSIRRLVSAFVDSVLTQVKQIKTIFKFSILIFYFLYLNSWMHQYKQATLKNHPKNQTNVNKMTKCSTNRRRQPLPTRNSPPNASFCAASRRRWCPRCPQILSKYVLKLKKVLLFIY